MTDEQIILDLRSSDAAFRREVAVEAKVHPDTIDRFISERPTRTKRLHPNTREKVEAALNRRRTQKGV